MFYKSIAISAGLLMGGLASAQNAEESPDHIISEIDQIVVSGAMTPLTINQLGSAATVIGRDEIERRQVRYVTDLLRSVPGFSVSRTGVTGSQTQVRVRGAEANHVLVMIDGVRATDPATGDEFRWEHLTTTNIERIEIVRGPQSALWGSDAVAAVVNVITRSGSNGSGVDGFVESGSNKTINGGFNGVIGDDGWSLTGSVERLETDGSNVSRSGDEDDNSDITTASLGGQIDATDNLSFNVGLRAVDAYSQFDPVDFFVTGLPVDGDLATESTNLYARAGASLKTHEGRVTHQLIANYFDSDHTNLIDQIEDSSTGSDRVTFRYQSDIALRENGLSLALEHQQASYEYQGAVIFGDPNQKQKRDITSVIAEYQGLSIERFTWLLSGRYDDNSDFEDAINGRLSLSYKLSEETTLRGSVGTGQKDPTFTEQFGFFPGQFIGNPDLKPEQSVSFDIGVDRSFSDGAVLLQATLFHQDLKDEINGFVFDPVTFLVTAENVDGKSERSGVELAARWTVNENVSLNSSYTYTDATEDDSSGGSVRELRRPEHAGSISADFTTSNERFSASLFADYGGDRSDIFFPPFPAPSEIVTLKSYWLLDLTAQYALTPSVTVFVRGANLLDENYEEVYGYRTLGRTAYLGARINFGR